MINEKRKRVFTFYCMAFAILVLAGCGRSHEAAVWGVVTLDGKPLPRGTVAFQPVTGGPLAYAGIHSDGGYEVSTGTDRGLAAGEYVVTVVANEAPANGNNIELVPKLLTPSRYGNTETSGLQFKVTAGSNQIDLRLTSP